MPADIDLRAEVLAGIDRELAIADNIYMGGNRMRLLTALRHLREIVEKHRMLQNSDMAWCDGCGAEDECPTLLSLAPDYAPQALAKMEVDRG